MQTAKQHHQLYVCRLWAVKQAMSGEQLQRHPEAVVLDPYLEDHRLSRQQAHTGRRLLLQTKPWLAVRPRWVVLSFLRLRKRKFDHNESPGQVKHWCKAQRMDAYSCMQAVQALDESSQHSTGAYQSKPRNNAGHLQRLKCVAGRLAADSTLAITTEL